MKYKLSQIMDIIGGGTPKTSIAEYWGGEIPWLSVKDFNNDLRYVYESEKHITEKGLNNSSTVLLEEDDTIISARGTVGELAMIPFPMAFNQSCYGLRAKPDIVDKVYLYYLVKNKVGELKKKTHGTVFDTITRDTFDGLEVDIPELSKQKQIASILKDIDDKIELNIRINNNLMQQIQSLFSDWFVTFTPFGGNKPSSWNKTDIYAISKVIYGAPFASKAFNTERNGVPIIRIRDLKEQQFVTYTTETHPKGYLLKPGDVVVGMDGEFRPYIWGNDKAWLNQRVCVFENKRPNGKAFLYCVIKPLLYAIEQTQVGTTVIHIGKKDFDSFEFWLPEDCVLDKFDSLTNPMYQQIVFSLLENKKLVVLRDTLLPKLLSGEINVSDIDL